MKIKDAFSSTKIVSFYNPALLTGSCTPNTPRSVLKSCFSTGMHFLLVTDRWSNYNERRSNSSNVIEIASNFYLLKQINFDILKFRLKQQTSVRGIQCCGVYSPEPRSEVHCVGLILTYRNWSIVGNFNLETTGFHAK